MKKMFALFAVLAVMASCGNVKTTDEVESTEIEVVDSVQESDVAPSQESDVVTEGVEEKPVQPAVE